MPKFDFHRKSGFIFAFIFGITILILMRGKINLTLGQMVSLPFVVFVYSNAPDLDFFMGRLQKKLLIILFSAMALSVFILYFIKKELMVILIAIFGLLGIGMMKLRHRGILHTYWFAVIISLPLLFIHWFVFLIGLICTFTHIFIDRIYSWLRRRMKRIFGFNSKKEYHFIFR